MFNRSLNRSLFYVLQPSPSVLSNRKAGTQKTQHQAPKAYNMQVQGKQIWVWGLYFFSIAGSGECVEAVPNELRIPKFYVNPTI